MKVGTTIAAILLTAFPAIAQPEATSNFTLTAYGWLSATDGRIGADERAVSVSNSFIETMEDSDPIVSFMARGEFRQRRPGLFLDAMYTRLGYDNVPAGSFTANADSPMTIVEAGATWKLVGGRLGSKGNWALDVMGGARWSRIRNEISINSGGPSDDSRTDWLDPFVGLRLRGLFAPRWEYALRGDIGGFGVGSDFAWQAVASVGYRFEIFGLNTVAHVG